MPRGSSAQGPAENPAEACAAKNQTDAATVGQYKFTAYKSSDGACVQVTSGGKVVYNQSVDSFQTYTLGQPEDAQDNIPAIANGTDVTGRGQPDMIVSLFTGGAHCCTIHYVFELGPQFKLLATLNDSDDDLAHFERGADRALRLRDGRLDFWLLADVLCVFAVGAGDAALDGRCQGRRIPSGDGQDADARADDSGVEQGAERGAEGGGGGRCRFHRNDDVADGVEPDLRRAIGSGVEVCGCTGAEGAAKPTADARGFLLAAEDEPVLAGFAADVEGYAAGMRQCPGKSAAVAAKRFVESTFPQGLKANKIFVLMAPLKSCPDTSCFDDEVVPPTSATRAPNHSRQLQIDSPRSVKRVPDALVSKLQNHHALGSPRLRIVLSNIGTFGDINPLIAIALELKRRGHTPVMALPNVYRPKIEPLGLEFHALRPDIDPTNSKLVEMVYDVKKGTETGLREFLYPVLRQTYDDLLDAATKPARADLLLLGELNYAGPIVAEVTGIPWASYVLAPFSFFSAFDPPVLPPFPKLARADKAPGMGRAMKRLARFVTRKWPEPVYELRRELGLPKGKNPIFDAKHSPNLVLALFSRVLGD